MEKKRIKRQNYLLRECILTSLITALAISNVNAQSISPVPRIVVSICIDQLRTDYMEAFAPLYGERGFKRLLKEGKVFRNASYSFAGADRASAVASLYTGTSPYNNGIIAEQWLDRATLRPVYCVDDKQWGGALTAETTSPKHLVVSTIGDELKVATEGRSVVYSVSPYRDAAVLAAGHTADGAFWINDLTGKWCGSSYYGVFPQWALAYNNQQGLNASSIVWEPSSVAVGSYNYFVSGGVRSPFKHVFSGNRKIRDYKVSGLVNSEVTSFATTCLKCTTLGNDAITDMLEVAYYAGNFGHKTVTECPLEIQDTYVRLDTEISRLIDAVEAKVGRNNALFVITSTGYTDNETADLSKYRIPTGTFYLNRTAALLNMYLMATYGQGQYVEACYGSQIYLNHKLIEKKQLNLIDVMERSQEFLIQSAGVKDVYTSQRLTLGAWTPGISRIRNAYNPKTSGDIYIEVSPGWNLVNEDMHETRLVRDSYIEFPIIFHGAGVSPKTEFEPVTVDYVAPTLSRSMRIRAPNACSVAPVTL